MSQTSREPGSEPDKNDWLKQFSGLPGEPAANQPPPPPRSESTTLEESEVEDVALADDKPASPMTSSHRMLYFQLMVLPLLLIAAIVIYEVSK